MIKLMVMGYARSGKDTVCQILQDAYKLKFKSSSEFACERFIYPLLRDTEGYSTIEECFNDRVNKRALWFDLIEAYSEHEKTRLSKELFAEYDVYCGIRNRDEFLAARRAKLFDYAIWVDAGQRVDVESSESCTVSRDDADFTLNNSGDLDSLKWQVGLLMHRIFTVKAARDEAAEKRLVVL